MTELDELLDSYERANRDEAGPLSAGAFTAVYRASQGLSVSRIAPDTEAGNAEVATWCEAMLARILAIDPQRLDEQQRLSAAVLRAAIERRLESTRHYWHVITVTPYRSFVTAFRMIFATFDVGSEETRARYLDVVRDVGAYVRASRAKLVDQVRRGIVLPQRTLAPIVAIHRNAAQVEASPFLPRNPSEDFLPEVHAALRAHVAPALLELCEYLGGAYAEAASSGWGQSAYPGGEAYYRYLVRDNTTLDIAPETIHERGLAVVRDLREAMAEVRERLGFIGTAREFHEQLRNDPRFVPSTPDAIGKKLDHFANLANDALDEFFLRRPAAPFSAKRLPEALEAGMTFGYYHPGAQQGAEGHYFYNGSKLHERSLISIASLALHELVPGHHYEINIARENPALPSFRSFQAISTYIAAYHEGWAEYAADLGKEFGAYEDPYDLYGRHALDIFISSRLVVDTGMNLLGWTFERAQEFMREHTLLSDTEITSELLRYASDLPAQALAYKLGSMKFAELRATARERLGSAFDLRRFHDQIVMNGGMPLRLVESEIARFIDERARN